LLISAWCSCPIIGPGSGFVPEEGQEIDPRAALALARVNWLHEKYPISNENFLYTLSLFMLEPGRWITRFEWREMTPIEMQAFFVFWSEIGRRMNIKDIPKTQEELLRWSVEYEKKQMVPHEVNRVISEHTIALLLYTMPSFLKPFGRKVVIALLEDRLRGAMMQPIQPQWFIKMVRGLLYTRAFFIRHFCLPRTKSGVLFPCKAKPTIPASCPASQANGGKKELPRLHPNFYMNVPWYVPESTGLGAVFDWLQSAVGYKREDELPGPALKSQGFRLEELGPVKFEGRGLDEVLSRAEKMQGQPVTGPWSFEVPQ
jgi:hypothetical protein